MLICNATISNDMFLSNVNLSWVHNGGVPDGVLNETEDGLSTITLNPVRTEHNGNYTCTGYLMLQGVQIMSQVSETYLFRAIGKLIDSG